MEVLGGILEEGQLRYLLTKSTHNVRPGGHVNTCRYACSQCQVLYCKPEQAMESTGCWVKSHIHSGGSSPGSFKGSLLITNSTGTRRTREFRFPLRRNQTGFDPLAVLRILPLRFAFSWP